MACLNCATKFHSLNNTVLLRYLPSRRLIKLSGHVRYCFNDNYSSEEKDKILNIVNTAKHDDFQQFGVSKKSIASLIKLQRQKGALQSLDELKPVFSTKVLDKMFSSMLNKGNMISGPATYPVLKPQQISEFNRVLSFTISGDCVSICFIHRNNGILTVQSLSIINYSFKPRMHFLAILKEIKEVALKLPECDLIITEDVPTNTVSQNAFNFQLQMAQTRSMFLGFKSGMENPPTIISIKRLAVARLFNTFIGSEKVSGQPIVEKLLTESPNLKLNTGILEDFMASEPPIKELLSNVVLLNLSYWKLTKQFKLSQNTNEG